MYTSTSITPRAVISTLVTPWEQQRLESQNAKGYRLLHRNAMHELSYDVRTGGTDTIAISVVRFQMSDVEPMTSLLREYPRLPAVALLTEVDQRAPQVMLALGRCGVHEIVDLRRPDGWHVLHYVLSRARPDGVHHTAMTMLSETLEPTAETTEIWAFFETIFSTPVTIRTVRQLTATMKISESTFLNRFYRLQLPHAKHYLAMARLARAAHMLEDRHTPIARVADVLGYASPQSFARHVRNTLHVTPTAFREQYTTKRVIHLFRDQLVKPYVRELQKFTPVPRGTAEISPLARQSTRRKGITKQR